VWNKIVNLELTTALYYVLKEKDKGNSDSWYDFIAGVIFSVLNHAEKDLNRFNAVGSRQKEVVSSSYFDLQTVLTRMNRASLESTSASFQRQLSAHSFQRYEKELLQALLQLYNEPKPDRKAIEQINRQVFDRSPDNPYQELFVALGKN
jgi:hypothetical protein